MSSSGKSLSVSVGMFMSPSPQCIGSDQSLEFAADRMTELCVRHLPVREGGTLVGVISERDIALIGSIAPDALCDLKVEEAMTGVPYCVSSGAPLGEVAAHMASRKLGSALVMEQGKLVGIFTVTDALRALAGLVEDEAVDRASRQSELPMN